MFSVTQRAQKFKQPYGGFIKSSDFEKIVLNDGNDLNDCENVNPIVVGITVDYMTRYMMGTPMEKVFLISLQGIYIAMKLKYGEELLKDAAEIVNGIVGLDDESIINACKLSTFDAWRRNCFAAMTMKKDYATTEPDAATIENIRIMVERGLHMWEIYGPLVKDGFTFEPNGYTDIVSSGDGDYLTADTIWDYKVSKNRITSKQTLQLLMYWIMGKHSGKKEFDTINRIGFFNPRQNVAYLLETKNIPKKTILEVEREVIGYTTTIT